MKTQHVTTQPGDAKHRQGSSAISRPSPADIARDKVKSGPGSARPKPKASAKQGNGNGNGNGNGHSAAVHQAPLKQGPTYGSGARFDTGLHYASAEPVIETIPGGAKVRLELSPRTDSNLTAFGEANDAAMTGNPNFPNPVPSMAIFRAKLSEFEDLQGQLENLRVQVKNLTEQKDRVRAEFQALFTQRGQYVEMASNGDPDIIATSGLPLRRPPTPVGQLPWPEALKVEQSQVVGELIVRWASVNAAKGYLLQCAEVVADKPREWVNAYTGGKFTSSQKSLTPGKTYDFRVAALGGSTGQSEFSPVVSRMAA